MTDLKPCPGCGGKAELIANRALSMWGYYVVCLDCFKRTALCDTPEEAIASWNEETTPLADVSSDNGMDANPMFCCKDLFRMMLHNRKNVCILNGKYLAINGDDNCITPVKYCPSCGKEIRLTFLADSEVDE